jgi:hypothetical protein
VYKPTELEQRMVEVMDSHASNVACLGLGLKAEVKSDILNGMLHIWQAVSQLSMNNT